MRWTAETTAETTGGLKEIRSACSRVHLTAGMKVGPREIHSVQTRAVKTAETKAGLMADLMAGMRVDSREIY